MATKQQRVTTSQVAGLLGVTPQAVRQRVARGKLVPLETLANGHYLFDLEQFRGEFDPADFAAVS